MTARYRDLLALLSAFPKSEGWLEFRARHPIDPARVRRAFFRPDDSEAIARWLANRGGHTHAFMGIALRDGEGGTKAHLVSLPALWADIDDTSVALPSTVPAPSAVVLSGRGRHLYWMLEQAIALDGRRVRYVDAVLRGLAHAVGADRAAAEAAHLLRAPGTLNPKYAPPVRARLLELEPARRAPFHRFAAFAEFSANDPAPFVAPLHRPPPPDDAVARVLAGCRFLQWTEEAPAEVSEPLWHAALTNLAPFAGGFAAARRLSERYPRFSLRELQQKFRHAQAHCRPHTCRRIVSLGFSECGGCPWQGVVRSPAAIALKHSRRRRTR